MLKFIEKFWNVLVTFLNGIRRDRLYHFIVGIVIASFCYITLSMGWFSCIPAIVAGVLKECWDKLTDCNFDWIDLLATSAGPVALVLFQLIGLAL